MVETNLLLVVEYVFRVQHDLFLPREHTREQLHGVVHILYAQPPYVLLLRARKLWFKDFRLPFYGLADFPDLKVLGSELLLIHF